MPELPEVETVSRDLQSKIIGKKISKIHISLQKIVHGSLADFKKNLTRASFQKITRRGKLIILEINSDLFLTVHLRMTGQLIYQAGAELIAGGHSDTKINLDLPHKQTHAYFVFSDNSKLFFNDQRQFGYLELVNHHRLREVKKRFGLEPLSRSFTLRNFQKLIAGRQRNVKAFLLDQSFIAGLGNIYVDEILFASGIAPQRKLDSLNSTEIKLLWKNIKQILQKAIQFRGTTFNNYVDTAGKQGGFLKLLQVYRQNGQKCPQCHAIIQKVKIAGRGTHFCPRCQK